MGSKQPKPSVKRDDGFWYTSDGKFDYEANAAAEPDHEKLRAFDEEVRASFKLKPLSDEEREQRWLANQIWREECAERERQMDAANERDRIAKAEREAAIAAASAREKAKVQARERSADIARQTRQHEQSLALTCLQREAQQQGQWRNHVKSSLWHEQTSRIIAELGEMINPKPPPPEPEEVLSAVNEGMDEMRAELADFKKLIGERK